jgi:hypothetical protein
LVRYRRRTAEAVYRCWKAPGSAERTCGDLALRGHAAGAWVPEIQTSRRAGSSVFCHLVWGHRYSSMIISISPLGRRSRDTLRPRKVRWMSILAGGCRYSGSRGHCPQTPHQGSAARGPLARRVASRMYGWHEGYSSLRRSCLRAFLHCRTWDDHWLDWSARADS